MSKMKDEWDDYIQSRRNKFPNSKTDRYGFNNYLEGVNRIKGENNFGNNEDVFAIEDDCECETCVTFTAWDDLYPSDFELDSLDVYEELWDILLKKQSDYGPNNIRNAPGGPLNGLQVRLYDKMSRLINLIESGVKPENESLRDTFVDIANYGVIGVMLLDNTFPEAKDYNES